MNILELSTWELTNNYIIGKIFLYIYQLEYYLTVSYGLLRQIVVDDEGVLAVVTEELAHGAARVGREILQGSGIGRGSWYDDGVVDGTWIMLSVFRSWTE